MPVHDWSKVDAGIFHAFHHDWITELSRALNRGVLPKDYYALPEFPSKETAGIKSETGRYAAKAKSIVIRHVDGHRVIALIEIVSPGTKVNRKALHFFVQKSKGAIASGVHLLAIDITRPSLRDTQGIHGAMWKEICGKAFVLPAARPLTCVSYCARSKATAFVQPIGIEQPLPEMPLFLTPESYVSVGLEGTYQEAWHAMPDYWRGILANGQS